MAEGNSIQQNNSALVEWASRVSLAQIPGLLLFSRVSNRDQRENKRT